MFDLFRNLRHGRELLVINQLNVLLTVMRQSLAPCWIYHSSSDGFVVVYSVMPVTAETEVDEREKNTLTSRRNDTRDERR